ncbi:hypothetical protein [Methylopila sp. M107]|uniref:hypothetical protein n=1 Tax=Methylopila sp. M107 TaxID=1101190 RepID=UPI0003801EE2|nr:hypothetical protein [Methylopila sp. M107]
MSAPVAKTVAPRARLSPAISAREMAALLRGEARVSDGAAIALFARLGLGATETLALLPQARRLACANHGA